LFSLYSNDLFAIKPKGADELMGYYIGTDRDNAKITFRVHDRNVSVGDSGELRASTKTAERIVKYQVDVLGRIYPAPLETRRGLA
jgi:CRISPR-associated endonuclease Csn1